MNFKLKNLSIKKLLVIDAFGALISFIMLGIVFVRYLTFTGIQKNALYLLAIFPVIFFCFSIYGSFHKKYERRFLRINAMANISYCLFSMSVVILHLHLITSIGIIYFLAEIILVLLLARFELIMANAKEIN